MALFDWTDELLVGCAFIDNDHKKLIQLLNDFHLAVAESSSNARLASVLHHLIACMREHFRREEDEMARIRYSMALHHKIEHEKLLKQVGDLAADFKNGSMTMTPKVSQFLKDWLFSHILETDQLLARAIRDV